MGFNNGKLEVKEPTGSQPEKTTSSTPQNFVDPKSNANNFLSYACSKSALNTYTVLLSHLLKEVRVNAVSPGYCSTNLNNFAGILDAKDTVKQMVDKVVFLEKDGPTGTLFDYDGTVLAL